MVNAVFNGVIVSCFSFLAYLIPVALTVREPGTKTTNLLKIIGALIPMIVFVVVALYTGLGALYALGVAAVVLLFEAKFLYKASWKDSIAFCIAITVGALALLILFMPLIYWAGGEIPIYAFPRI